LGRKKKFPKHFKENLGAIRRGRRGKKERIGGKVPPEEPGRRCALHDSMLSSGISGWEIKRGILRNCKKKKKESTDLEILSPPKEGGKGT